MGDLFLPYVGTQRRAVQLYGRQQVYMPQTQGYWRRRVENIEVGTKSTDAGGVTLSRREGQSSTPEIFFGKFVVKILPFGVCVCVFEVRNVILKKLH